MSNLCLFLLIGAKIYNKIGNHTFFLTFSSFFLRLQVLLPQKDVIQHNFRNIFPTPEKYFFQTSKKKTKRERKQNVIWLFIQPCKRYATQTFLIAYHIFVTQKGVSAFLSACFRGSLPFPHPKKSVKSPKKWLFLSPRSAKLSNPMLFDRSFYFFSSLSSPTSTDEEKSDFSN